MTHEMRPRTVRSALEFFFLNLAEVMLPSRLYRCLSIAVDTILPRCCFLCALIGTRRAGSGPKPTHLTITDLVNVSNRAKISYLYRLSGQFPHFHVTLMLWPAEMSSQPVRITKSSLIKNKRLHIQPGQRTDRTILEHRIGRYPT
jgi:hypothetical protein